MEEAIHECLDTLGMKQIDIFKMHELREDPTGITGEVRGNAFAIIRKRALSGLSVSQLIILMLWKEWLRCLNATLFSHLSIIQGWESAGEAAGVQVKKWSRQ